MNWTDLSKIFRDIAQPNSEIERVKNYCSKRGYICTLLAICLPFAEVLEELNSWMIWYGGRGLYPT